MLTEAEKKWLEERETLITENEAWYTCAYCEKFRPNYLCRSALCPVEVGHVHKRNVAEFEALVAASIAQDAYNCAQDEMLFQHQEGDKPQGWYILRDARLAVEEEMQ
jgi:hypothetical protein